MGQQVDDDLLDEDGNASAGGDQHLFGGVWTRIKLEALEKYVGAFNTALSKQRFTRIYVDAFAGTGRCDIKVNGEKTSIDGSARRALAANPGLHKYGVVELLPRKLVALRSLCSQYQWRNERAVLFPRPIWNARRLLLIAFPSLSLVLPK